MKEGERREEGHFTHRQSRRVEGEGGGGAEVVASAVHSRCGHRIAIIRRAGEDDDGDRDCVLGVRAYYGLRGENRDIMCLQTKGGGESVVHNQCSRPGIQTIEFVYLGGAITAETLAMKCRDALLLDGSITADRDLSNEITRRI